MSAIQKRRPREEHQTKSGTDGRTHQSDLDAADINTIMGRYRETGYMPQVNLGTPVYADFSNATDYLTAMNQIKAAQDLFDSLPARVRRECNNNPEELIALVEDPDKAELLVELGLRNPVEPVPVEAAPPKTPGRPSNTEATPSPPPEEAPPE